MAAYRESFRDELAPGQVDELRWAAPGKFAPGRESLAMQMSVALWSCGVLEIQPVMQAGGAAIQSSILLT